MEMGKISIFLSAEFSIFEHKTTNFLSAEFLFSERRILGGPFRAPLQFSSAKFAFLSAEFLFFSAEFAIF